MNMKRVKKNNFIERYTVNDKRYTRVNTFDGRYYVYVISIFNSDYVNVTLFPQ